VVKKTYSRNALAGFYRRAQVGLVTPMRDGMNLVAKEYVAAQDPADPGVLVLSRFAGAAQQMSEALIVNPYDTHEVAEAIRTALAMPKSERVRRFERLYTTIASTDIGWWTRRYLEALSGIEAAAPDIAAPQPRRAAAGKALRLAASARQKGGKPAKAGAKRISPRAVDSAPPAGADLRLP
jgi:trehalose 6-phosphate synthase